MLRPLPAQRLVVNRAANGSEYPENQHVTFATLSLLPQRVVVLSLLISLPLGRWKYVQPTRARLRGGALGLL